jgi:hypothetical protein
MGLPYQTEDYDEVGGGGSGSASTVNDLGGMNFSSIQNNEMLKRVDADNVGGSDLYSTSTTSGNQYYNILYSNVNNNQLGSILLEKNNTTYNVELRPNPSTTNSLIVKEDGTGQAYVGINVLNPEEALDIEGNLELRGGSGKIFFKHPSGLQKVELDGDQDGAGNGGKFIVKTKVDGGSMTEKLTIDNAGLATFSGNVNIEGNWSGEGLVNFGSARAQTFNVTSFTAFKTDGDEILGDTTPEPISCTAYTDSGQKAVIQTTHGSGYHLLSPNGENIHNHLTTNYEPKFVTDEVHTGTFGAGDNTGSVGYMKMGTIDAALNHQGIAHSNHFNSTNYALKQRPDGLTEINCASGRYILFRTANSHPPELSLSTNYNIFYGFLTCAGSRDVLLSRIRYDLHADINGDYWVVPENQSNVPTTVYTTLGLRVDSAIYGSTYYQSSDDRRKHNELKYVDGDGIRIINKLQPLVYEKTEKLYDYGETRPVDDTNYIIESGFIAQEVLKIPELSFAVRGGDYVNEEGENVKQEYSLDYQSIWTVAVKAIQELSTEITQLKERIAQLEA